jgi:hypothetical protein
MILGAAIAASAGSRASAADLYIPQPIVPVDDTLSQGPVARDWTWASVDATLVRGPSTAAGTGDVGLFKYRLELGPPTADGLVGTLLGGAENFAFRTELAQVAYETPSGSSTSAAGPMTFALQHYSPFPILNIIPLVHLHVGIETAVATHWLSARYLVPPAALRTIAGVDTELANNGWSLRPFSPYLRADFTACRDLYFELGVAPELFIPTDHSAEYDLRYHVAGGASLACQHPGGRSRLRHVALTGEYRGRLQLYAGSLPFEYRDSLAIALQVDVPTKVVNLTFQVFAEDAPSLSWWTYRAAGVRLQVGFNGRSVQ